MKWPSSSSEHLNDLLRMVANTCVLPTFMANPVVVPCSLHNTSVSWMIIFILMIIVRYYVDFLLQTRGQLNSICVRYKLDITIAIFCDVLHCIPNTDMILYKTKVLCISINSTVYVCVHTFTSIWMHSVVLHVKWSAESSQRSNNTYNICKELQAHLDDSDQPQAADCFGVVQHSGSVIGGYTLLIGTDEVLKNSRIHKNKIRISDFIGSINQPSSLSVIGIQQLTFRWCPIPWWSCIYVHGFALIS